MDQIYANSNSTFGIYVHELAYVPIFKTFAHFLADLLTLTFVLLVSLITQVSETHIDVCISSEISSHNFQSLSLMKIWYFTLDCSHFHESICVSATYAVGGTGATNLY